MRLVPELNGLEEIGQDLVVIFKQFQVHGWVEWQIKWQLLFLDSKDVVDEGVYVLLLY